MLPNSPFTAKAAVARPSKKTPAIVDFIQVLSIAYLSLGGWGIITYAGSITPYK
jgi:hypothetical protein